MQIPAFCALLFALGISAMKSDINEKPRASGKVLVSGYSSEIALYTLVSDSLTRTQSWLVDPNLTWLEQANGSFWAIHEVEEYAGVAGGAVSRWELVDGSLARREYTGLQSAGPAHLLVDLDHSLAYTANYGGGTVTVLSLVDGKLAQVVQLLQYGEGCRDKSHPHHVVRMGDIVFIVDLGCDAIYSYRVAGGQLNLLGQTSVEAGAGPRHMVLQGDLALVACELKNMVLVFKVDAATGSLQLLQSTPISDVNTNFGAEILVAGSYVYVSSRGTGVVSVFSLAGNQLTKIQEKQLTGTWPRSIAIKDDIMVVADQKGDTVQILRIDRSGTLIDAGVLETPAAPAFVMFYD